MLIRVSVSKKECAFVSYVVVSHTTLRDQTDVWNCNNRLASHRSMFLFPQKKEADHDPAAAAKLEFKSPRSQINPKRKLAVSEALHFLTSKLV